MRNLKLVCLLSSREGRHRTSQGRPLVAYLRLYLVHILHENLFASPRCARGPSFDSTDTARKESARAVGGKAPFHRLNWSVKLVAEDLGGS
eukprot:62419-Pleurochrysis_carterae.AAC.3